MLINLFMSLLTKQSTQDSNFHRYLNLGNFERNKVPIHWFKMDLDILKINFKQE